MYINFNNLKNFTLTKIDLCRNIYNIIFPLNNFKVEGRKCYLYLEKIHGYTVKCTIVYYLWQLILMLCISLNKTDTLIKIRKNDKSKHELYLDTYSFFFLIPQICL